MNERATGRKDCGLRPPHTDMEVLLWIPSYALPAIDNESSTFCFGSPAGIPPPLSPALSLSLTSSKGPSWSASCPTRPTNGCHTGSHNFLARNGLWSTPIATPAHTHRRRPRRPISRRAGPALTDTDHLAPHGVRTPLPAGPGPGRPAPTLPAWAPPAAAAPTQHLPPRHYGHGGQEQRRLAG